MLVCDMACMCNGCQKTCSAETVPRCGVSTLLRLCEPPAEHSPEVDFGPCTAIFSADEESGQPCEPWRMGSARCCSWKVGEIKSRQTGKDASIQRFRRLHCNV
jgi:hypothetical protein